DFNLPLGKLRLRPAGSAGGQNGLKDILQQLRTDEVPRMRMGVGPVPGGRDVVGFVLGKFASEEKDEVAAMTLAAADAAQCWAERGVDAAMNEFN
ncbi:MAG: aminoacyl-tRNA hydrolase, partial [Planctomycetota bacterium]